MHRLRRALRIARLTKSLGDYDSNVIGMAGEIVAEHELGMIKTERQSKGIDGHAVIDGRQRTVQVKSLSTTRLRQHGGKTTFKVSKLPEPEHLFVVVVYEKKTAHETIYSGPTAEVGRLARTNWSLRRPISVEDLFVGRQAELEELLERCRDDA